MGQYPEAPCFPGHNPECVPGGTASGSQGPGAMRACSAPSSSGPWPLHLWDCHLHCSCNLDLMSPGRISPSLFPFSSPTSPTKPTPHPTQDLWPRAFPSAGHGGRAGCPLTHHPTVSLISASLPAQGDDGPTGEAPPGLNTTTRRARHV